VKYRAMIKIGRNTKVYRLNPTETAIRSALKDEKMYAGISLLFMADPSYYVPPKGGRASTRGSRLSIRMQITLFTEYYDTNDNLSSKI
jgi:hypothetical protein